MSNGSNYQILELVATGGTAVLYRAVQTSLERVVAIKKLHQHLTEDENFTRRFVLEAKAAASLDHENIVKIIDFGIEDDAYHMVMEYIAGESLRATLDKWKLLPTDLALAITYSVCMGLEHAHNKGIIHRDIKPGNIMLTRTGRIKITDFGLAKLMQGATHQTAANSILGTPLYMSPEQAYGESVDVRSDIFSLGTMLYEMLTGVQPFRDDNYMGVIQNILKRNAPHPSKFGVDVPPPVQQILSKSMNKSREARFQSAGQFKKAIETYLGLEHLKVATESVKSLVASEGSTMQLPKSHRPRPTTPAARKGFVVMLILACLVGGGAAGIAYAPASMTQQILGALPWPPYGNLQGSDMLAVDIPDSYLDAQPDTTRRTPLVLRDTVRVSVRDTVVIKPPPDTVRTTITNTTPVVEKPKDTDEPVKVVQPRMGWLSINAEPWGEVYVDGRYRGDTPVQIELTRGIHSVECRNPKYVEYQENVRITAGEMSTRSIVMKKLGGRVTITTDPGAEIYVDGKLIGVTPLQKPLEIDAGDHQVTVKKAGYNVWNNQITVRANETLPLNITLSKIY